MPSVSEPSSFIAAGFCESSLAHVERLNVDTLLWEELSPVLTPRTKFCVIQNPSDAGEVFILGGKDQDG